MGPPQLGRPKFAASGAVAPSTSRKPDPPGVRWSCRTNWYRRSSGGGCAAPKGEHELAFPDAKGNPIQSSDLLRTGLHSALRRAGLRQVRFHDLRHSFASNLLAAGIDVVTVSKALGHSNPHITFTVYAHAIPKQRQGAGDAFGRLMAQSGNKMETLTPETASVA